MITYIYIITINILAFILMGLDKHYAKNNLYRISENTLLSIALLGGSIGELLGMIIFHHKTKKYKFKILIPIFLIINIYIYTKILLK